MTRCKPCTNLSISPRRRRRVNVSFPRLFSRFSLFPFATDDIISDGKSAGFDALLGSVDHSHLLDSSQVERMQIKKLQNFQILAPRRNLGLRLSWYRHRLFKVNQTLCIMLYIITSPDMKDTTTICILLKQPIYDCSFISLRFGLCVLALSQSTLFPFSASTTPSSNTLPTWKYFL